MIVISFSIISQIHYPVPKYRTQIPIWCQIYIAVHFVLNIMVMDMYGSKYEVGLDMVRIDYIIGSHIVAVDNRWRYFSLLTQRLKVKLFTWYVRSDLFSFNSASMLKAF